MQALGQFVEEERTTLDWAVTEKGLTVVDAADEGFAELMETFVAAQDEAIVATARGQGVDDPEAIIASYRENFAKWQGLTEGIDDVDALTELLWTEVFSQIDLATF